MDYAQTHVIDGDNHNDFQEYFQYVMDTYELQTPTNWRGLNLYHVLLDHGENGV
jgi:hypothetical protein